MSTATRESHTATMLDRHGHEVRRITAGRRPAGSAPTSTTAGRGLVEDGLRFGPDVRGAAVRALHRVPGEHRTIEGRGFHRHSRADGFAGRRARDRDRTHRSSLLNNADCRRVGPRAATCLCDRLETVVRPTGSWSMWSPCRTDGEQAARCCQRLQQAPWTVAPRLARLEVLAPGSHRDLGNSIDIPQLGRWLTRDIRSWRSRTR